MSVTVIPERGKPFKDGNRSAKIVDCCEHCPYFYEQPMPLPESILVCEHPDVPEKKRMYIIDRTTGSFPTKCPLRKATKVQKWRDSLRPAKDQVVIFE